MSFPLSLTLVLLYSVFLKVTDFHCEKNESITSTVKSRAASLKKKSTFLGIKW